VDAVTGAIDDAERRATLAHDPSLLFVCPDRPEHVEVGPHGG
jgi:hypothetical protein